jgi:hypothetical protein
MKGTAVSAPGEAGGSEICRVSGVDFDDRSLAVSREGDGLCAADKGGAVASGLGIGGGVAGRAGGGTVIAAGGGGGGTEDPGTAGGRATGRTVSSVAGTTRRAGGAGVGGAGEMGAGRLTIGGAASGTRGTGGGSLAGEEVSALALWPDETCGRATASAA